MPTITITGLVPRAGGMKTISSESFPGVRTQSGRPHKDCPNVFFLGAVRGACLRVLL